jgi:hypothetical protein
MENSAAIQAAEIFAKLVAQEVRDRIMFGSRDDWVLAEREACAKVCEANVWSKPVAWWGETTKSEVSVEAGLQCAAAIRARGEA